MTNKCLDGPATFRQWYNLYWHEGIGQEPVENRSVTKSALANQYE